MLNGDTSLIEDVQNNMTSLFTSKDTLEEKQKKYQKLQDLINDTIEAYELESITYELASQKISSAIKTYFPELSGKYNFESGKLQEIIDKKKIDEETTKETSEGINKTVEEENKKLVESYTTLQKDLNEIFGKLNGMLQTYSDNVSTMVTTVSNAILQIQKQIDSLPSLNANISITSDATTNNSAKDNKNSKKNKEKVDGAGKSHSGLELGYIGESSTSKDKEAFKYIALSDLKDDEIVRVLQKNEAVLTEAQVAQTMSNFRKLAQFKVPTIIPNNTQASKSVNFNGDIVVQGVQDANGFAKALKAQLPQTILQELYK